MSDLEKVIEILQDLDDTIDYANEKALITDHIMDSFGVISLVAELEDAFDVSIGAAEMIPENFDSAEAILAMVQRLGE